MKKSEKYVLVLRSCKADMTSYAGFKWKSKGIVKAPDFKPDAVCGSGLHGWLWGEGDASLAISGDEGKWLVLRVKASEIIQLNGKVKFPACEVVFCGIRSEAVIYIQANGAAGKAVIFGTATAGNSGTATAGEYGTATAGNSGTATAGYRGTATAGISGTATAGISGTATAGYRGTATAGDSGTATAGNSGTATAGISGTATAGNSGTATAGDSGTATAGNSGTATAGEYGTATAGNSGTATAGEYGTATAGYRGTATAGISGTATAGEYGILEIEHWDGARHRKVVAYVGENGIKPNVKYTLNASGVFVPVDFAVVGA